MKDLAPEIIRQRLLIEAKYSALISEIEVRDYLLQLARKLKLKTYGQPIVHSPAGMGKERNQGFDAFIPLIDSGISIYVWVKARFLAVTLYTCKNFSVADAINFTKDYFSTKELEYEEF